jgi:hypothetical protein
MQQQKQYQDRLFEKLERERARKAQESTLQSCGEKSQELKQFVNEL